MTHKTSKHHFTCLPYINMQNVAEVDLGFAKVWNFDQLKDVYIPDVELREHLCKVMQTYKASYPYSGQDGRDVYSPIAGIGFISTGYPSYEEPNEQELQDVTDARLILFITALAFRNTYRRDVNSGHSMRASENFAPVHFSVVLGNPYMSELTGFAIPSWHGGIEIAKHMAVRPRFVPTPPFEIVSVFRKQNELLEALIQLRSKRKKVFRRIMSAVEVFYESYHNGPQPSHNARILLQASAFEILLTPAESARKVLKDFLRQNGDYPEDDRFSYKYETKKGLVTGSDTKRVIWADKFFSLRNRIAHGNVPKEKEFLFGPWQRHFDIALLFFVFCVKRKIEQSLRKELFDDDIVWKKWTDDLDHPPRTYIGFEYTNFGRRGWERMSRKRHSKH